MDRIAACETFAPLKQRLLVSCWTLHSECLLLTLLLVKSILRIVNGALRMERDNVRALNNNLASHADVLRASSRVPRPEHLLKRTATSIRFPTLGKLVFAIRNITREKIADFKMLSAVLISERLVLGC